MTETPQAAAAQSAWKLFQDPEFVREAKQVQATTLRTLLSAALGMTVVDELRIVITYQIGRRLLRPVVGQRLMGAIDAEAKGSGDAAVERVQAFLGHVVRLHRSVIE